jgi:hypothetical protein
MYYTYLYTCMRILIHKHVNIYVGGKRVLVETKLTRGQNVQKGPHDDEMVKMLEEAKKVS